MMLRLFKEFDLYNNDDQINRIFSNPKGFSEPFFSELGAERVDPVDATDYEGASFAHDLNCELPELPLKYDAAVDGGTLEHVFNFPIALKTSMNTVQIDGRVLKRFPYTDLAIRTEQIPLLSGARSTRCSLLPSDPRRLTFSYI